MNYARRRIGSLAVVTLLAFAACSSDDGNSSGADTTASPDSGTPSTDGTEPTSGTDVSTPATDAPAGGGTVTLGLPEDSDGWFPPTAAWGPSQNWVAWSLYDPLVLVDPDGSFQPYLANSISSNEDLTEWTLVLRPGVTFHDGSALTADVLMKNFEMLTAEELDQGEPTQADKLGGVSMEVVDEMTVLYRLETANAGFPGLLSTAIGAPFSVEAATTNGADAPSNPVGTGPFQFVSWTRDDRLVVERNPNYWQEGLPYLDGLTFRVLPEEETRSAALVAGDVDAIFSTDPRTALAVQDAGDSVIAYMSGIDNTTFAIPFNVKTPPLDDVRVRRALTLALDQEALIELRGGAGILSPATQPFDESSPWYSQAAADAYASYDVDAGAALLEEYMNDPARSDGKAVGEPVTFTYDTFPDPSQDSVNLAIVDMWAQVGAEVTYQPYADEDAWLAGVLGTFEGDTPFYASFGATSFSFEVGSQDPSTGLGAFFGDPITGIVNISDYTSPGVEEGLVGLSSTTDSAARRAAVEQVSVTLAEDAPHAYAGNTVAVIGASNALENVDGWVFPDGSPGSGTAGGVTLWSQVRRA